MSETLTERNPEFLRFEVLPSNLPGARAECKNTPSKSPPHLQLILPSKAGFAHVNIHAHVSRGRVRVHRGNVGPQASHALHHALEVHRSTGASGKLGGSAVGTVMGCSKTGLYTVVSE